MLFREADYRVPTAFLCDPLFATEEATGGSLYARCTTEGGTVYRKPLLGFPRKTGWANAIVFKLGTRERERPYRELRGERTTKGVLEAVSERFILVGFPTRRIQRGGC